MITQKQHLTANPQPPGNHESIAAKLRARGLNDATTSSDTGLQRP